jgi:hypothetical protein
VRMRTRSRERCRCGCGLSLSEVVGSLSLESCRSRTHCLPLVACADVAERVGGGERPPRGPVALSQHPAGYPLLVSDRARETVLIP